MDDVSQFYTGLGADLHSPLPGYRSPARDFTAFLERAEPPALEICCGDGAPMLDLIELGFDVDGVDASQDMLDRCLTAARRRDLNASVYHQRIESFSIDRRYAAVFFAGGSFNLLPTSAAAMATLRGIGSHLTERGHIMIPIMTRASAPRRSTNTRR